MMKRFRNCLIGLITFGLSVISFSYGDGTSSLQSVNLYNGNSPTSFTCNGFCCIRNIDSASSSRSTSYFNYGGSSNIYFNTFSQNDFYCMNYSGQVKVYKTDSSTAHINFYDYGTLVSYPTCPTCPECETCPTCFGPNVNINKIECDGGDCSYSDNQLMYTQTGTFVFINLGSGVNFDSYHVGGNGNVNYYFSSEEVICPIYTGNEDLSGNWSALYINDIQHIGAPLINITIPEEFDWDYIYTGNGDEFDLDIKGYNVDTAYIDGIITTQKTLPNNTDFTNILSGLIPLFIPGLVIIACLYFIFRFIKKVF